MDDITFIQCLIFLAGVYLVVDILSVLVVFLFARERFNSWWRDEYVKTDEVYHVKYNRHGTPVSMKLNINNEKVKEQMRSSEND
ncbi:hypothetical protein VP249E411_P0024 [Vibrio phage 249E41-1]|nr:hypothetical protein VP249E411_P0024 [Vibrio phage 249E41-1]CAH9012083.1 hypothetical protein VP495E541_P0028 [Vibrio phage 495E54-1]CAH9012165.1 hypothetical protein VP496E541_P0028 [Vibrio phage 496E54-1]